MVPFRGIISNWKKHSLGKYDAIIVVGTLIHYENERGYFREPQVGRWMHTSNVKKIYKRNGITYCVTQNSRYILVNPMMENTP